MATAGPTPAENCGDGPRRWCAIAALSAGQPARLTGDEIYRELCADGYLARTCRDLLHDESVYGVTGDALILAV